VVNYREDERDTEQFKKDILQGSAWEAYIILCYAEYMFRSGKPFPTIEPNGVDVTGEYIEKDNDINHEPDFKINGTKVEVARSHKKCVRVFHEKISKTNRIIKENAYYLFANGIDNPKHTFILISPEELIQLKEMSIEKYGIVKMPGRGGGTCGKDAFRFSISWCPKEITLPSYNEANITEDNKWLLDIAQKRF